jgi:hypothetical protein
MATFGAGWKPALLTGEPETEALPPNITFSYNNG